QRKSHVERSRLDVPRMWRRAPARSECGSKFSKSRREFTGDSLDCRIERYGDLAMRTWQWSGQLWLGTQAPNETGRCEAGTYPRHKKPRLGERMRASYPSPVCSCGGGRLTEAGTLFLAALEVLHQTCDFQGVVDRRSQRLPLVN